MIFKIQFLVLIIQFGFKHNSTHVIFLIFLISVLQLIKFILLNGHLFKSIDLFQIPKIKLNLLFKIEVLKFQNYLLVFCFVLIIALFQITFGSITPAFNLSDFANLQLSNLVQVFLALILRAQLLYFLADSCAFQELNRKTLCLYHI